MAVALDHLSYSRVRTYLSCGEKYRLLYEEHYPRRPQGSFLGGIAVHETIEEAANTGLWADPDAFQEPDGIMLRWFRHRFMTLVEEAGAENIRWGGRKSKAFPQGEDLAWWLMFGPGMVNRYHQVKMQDKSEGWEVAVAEFKATGILDSEMPVEARIDELLVQEVVGAKGVHMNIFKVRDYKTGKPSPEERLQLATYAKALEYTMPGTPIVAGELVHLRKPKVEVFSFDAMPWMDLAMDWMQRAEAGIKAGLFPLQPSSYCASCEVQDGCSYWQRLNEGGAEIAAEVVGG